MRVRPSRSSSSSGAILVAAALVLVLGTGSCGAPATTTATPAPVMASASSGPVNASLPPAPSASASVISDDTSVAATIAPSASASTSVAPPPPAPGIVIGPGTRIFLFGDSMVTAGLGQRMEKLAKSRGAKYAENHWSSSTTKKWSESERLPNLLFKNKPDVVFIAIGSNEVYFLDKHADEYIKTIVKKLGGKPCVWIGPPVWKKQTGIVEAERDNSSPCAFFDSSTLQLDRQPDGIHPSLKGGAEWAEAVWAATVAP